jgi:hypothetical protein
MGREEIDAGPSTATAPALALLHAFPHLSCFGWVVARPAGQLETNLPVERDVVMSAATPPVGQRRRPHDQPRFLLLCYSEA